MNLFRKLLAATVAVSALAVPAVARIESGTPSLIRTAEAHGITFKYNPSDCDDGNYHGAYTGRSRTIELCYTLADANAHDTVRHEVWHAIQHCAAVKRDTPFEPIASISDLSTFVSSQLTDEHITRIKSSYPKDRWMTELEAFAAAEAYTAEQMSQLLKGWCG